MFWKRDIPVQLRHARSYTLMHPRWRRVNPESEGIMSTPAQSKGSIQPLALGIEATRRAIRRSFPLHIDATRSQTPTERQRAVGQSEERATDGERGKIEICSKSGLAR